MNVRKQLLKMLNECPAHKSCWTHLRFEPGYCSEHQKIFNGINSQWCKEGKIGDFRKYATSYLECPPKSFIVKEICCNVFLPIVSIVGLVGFIAFMFAALVSQ